VQFTWPREFAVARVIYFTGVSLKSTLLNSDLIRCFAYMSPLFTAVRFAEAPHLTLFGKRLEFRLKRGYFARNIFYL
jgi:hypothetical protein